MGWKQANSVEQPRVGIRVPGQERVQRLAMRKVQPAAARHQELAGRRRHAVVNSDGHPCLRQALGGNQSGRPRADDPRSLL